LVAENERLRAKIEIAAAIFEEYARQHRAKAEALRQPGTVQPSREPTAKARDLKAERNEQYAAEMRAALAHPQGEDTP
jgi:hypothetical protein